MINRTINSRVLQKLVAVSVVLGFCIATSVFAETVYIWRDADGVRQYADACPPGEKCRTREIGSMSSKRQAKWRDRVEATAANSGSTDTGSSTSGSDTTTDNNTEDTTSTGGTTTTAGDSTTEPTSDQSDDTNTAGDTTTDSPIVNTAILEWDPVEEPEVAGYRVYHAVAGGPYPPFGSGINAGSSTSITISRLDSGNRYYFRVTAVDNAGNESGFSNEVYKDFP